jgi:CRISPR-associated protein Csx3
MDTLWLWSDRVTIVLSLVAAVFSVWAWIRTTELIRTNRLAAERRRAEITIRFRATDTETGQSQTLDLPYRPRRDQLSRAELTGIISFYYGQPRFDPCTLRDLMESGQWSRVLAGDMDGPEDDQIVIDCSADMLLAIQAALVKKPPLAPNKSGLISDKSFTVHIVHEDADVCELKVGFSRPAENDQVVRDAAEAIQLLDLRGGPLVKFDGPCSLPVAMVLAHAVAHKYAAVAVLDPKLNASIIVISHDPARPIGARIQ